MFKVGDRVRVKRGHSPSGFLSPLHKGTVLSVSGAWGNCYVAFPEINGRYSIPFDSLVPIENGIQRARKILSKPKFRV